MREAFQRGARKRLRDIEPLPSPEALRRSVQAPARTAATVQQGRRALRDLIHGQDPRRLAVIVGPSAIHDPALALEYASRLRQLAQTLAGELLILMRTRLEPPLDAPDAKSLIHDPDLDGSGNVARGLRAARVLLRDVNALGVPCAAELLSPLLPAYLGDLLAWGDVAGRSVDSPVYRQLASGVEFPVGFQVAWNASPHVVCDAFRSATRSHRFPGIAPDGSLAVLESSGNPDLQLVVGGDADLGDFDSPLFDETTACATEAGISRPLLVDFSRGPAGNPRPHPAPACRALVRSLREGNAAIAGVLFECELEAVRGAGSPALPQRAPSQGCMGWNEGADLLCEIAEAVKLAG